MLAFGLSGGSQEILPPFPETFVLPRIHPERKVGKNSLFLDKCFQVRYKTVELWMTARTGEKG